MRRQWTALMSLRQGAVLNEIGVEFTNVLEAWNYAAAKQRAIILHVMAPSLWFFCDLRLPHPEGAALFGRAVEALEAVSPEKETEIALGFMMALQAYFIASDPKLVLQGKALSENGLVILRKCDCPEEMVWALIGLSRVNVFSLGEFTKGEQAAREGLAIARTHDFQWGIESTLFQLGYAACL